MPIKQPASASSASPHITATGRAALQAELEYLWCQQRPTVTAAVAAAAAMGDRSENAEYIYGKKQLREIDRRIRYLRKRLAHCVVVDTLPADTSCVYFGAWVSLRNAAGGVNCYRIVGVDEIDPQRGWISIDSPLARALLRKRVGESAVVHVPDGVDARKWLILTIDYTPPTEKNNA